MGWIFATLCAVIAVAFLYKTLLSNHTGKTATPRNKDKPLQSSDPIVRSKTNGVTRDKSQSILTQSGPESAPSIMIGDHSNSQQTTSPEGSISPATSAMPPPPMPQPKMLVTSTQESQYRSKSPPRLRPPTFGPAPPRPGGSALMPPPSAAASLRVPQQKVLQNTSMQPSSLKPAQNKPSRQVALEPGHSPLDWAALTANPTNNLRGKDLPSHLIRVTPSRLKAQNGRKGKDAWTVYQGKVYNITPYVPFHPGGKGEILRGAAKDSVKLFMEVHPWVNWDGMLSECLVGIMVREDDGGTMTNDLDEMD